MALSIRSPEVEALARRLARRSGKTMTDAILDALRAELARPIRGAPTPERLTKRRAIARRCARLRDRRPGFTERDLYDDEGLPR